MRLLPLLTGTKNGMTRGTHQLLEFKTSKDQDHASQLPPSLCKLRANSFCSQRCQMVMLFGNIPKLTEVCGLLW